MTSDTANIRFAGSTFGVHRHVCAFFHSEEDKYGALLPFIKEGFDHGDRALHVLDPSRRTDHLRRLRAAGIDTERAEATGQLKLHSCRPPIDEADASINPYPIISLIERELGRGPELGFRLTRLIVEMEFALDDQDGIKDHVEYEARLNYVLPKYPDPVVCVYDIAKFSGEVVIDILRTHPMVVMGGMLQENPFFVPPGEFLKQLADRRAAGDRPHALNGSAMRF
ncbi:MAG: hypothetical protein GC160_24350 [Acidobacteria bacterium]|nr:hypothetical protein [Acidobacteriota bacterium]